MIVDLFEALIATLRTVRSIRLAVCKVMETIKLGRCVHQP
jgi:hypothetical protein